MSLVKGLRVHVMIILCILVSDAVHPTHNLLYHGWILKGRDKAKNKFRPSEDKY